MTQPSITALRTDGYRMGFESMRLLETLLADQQPANVLIQIDAIELVRRESTSGESGGDPRAVQRALAFIRSEATRRNGIADVVRHVGEISRSKLD